MQCPGAGEEKSRLRQGNRGARRQFIDPAPPPRHLLSPGPRPGWRELGGPVVKVSVLVLDDDRTIVRAHARFGERESGCTKGAFGGNPADQPVRSSAARTMIGFMFAIDGVIAPLVWPQGFERRTCHDGLPFGSSNERAPHRLQVLNRALNL